MGSQNSLKFEWSNQEFIPKDDEFFSFPNQLPPLDLRYPELGCNAYDLLPVQQDHLDATFMMDNMYKDPLYSSLAIEPDPACYEEGFMVGTDSDQLGFLNQEMPIMNSLGFQNQQMPIMNYSFGFPNQEMSMMNSLGFLDQTQPEITTTKKVNNNGEAKMVRSRRPYKKGGEDNGDGDYGSNYPSRLMLSRETISQYFYMPITQAAKELNVGLTLLKKRCRELGIGRWPHRKLMSLQTLIKNVQELEKLSGNGAEEKLREAVTLLEKERKKMEEIPDLQLEGNTKRLRQACFKANYKKRKTMGASSKNSSALMAHQQSSSSCSSSCVDHGDYEVADDDYGGDEEQEIKSILFADWFPPSSNTLF